MRHVLPHAQSAALSATGIVFGGAVLAEAALAFVDLGGQHVTSWGQLIASVYAFVDHAWWMWAFPAFGTHGAGAGHRRTSGVNLFMLVPAVTMVMPVAPELGRQQQQRHPVFRRVFTQELRPSCGF
jgi:hypothetical protein